MAHDSTPSEFTLFPLLPPELRLHIYRHACHPRITVLAYDVSTNTFRCPTPPPTLLHVSREARAEGLRLYARCPLESSQLALIPEEEEDDDDDDDEETEAETGEPPNQHGLADAATTQRYVYHHPYLDTLYFPRPRDRFGTGYAGWARDFSGRLPALAGAVRRLAVDYVPGEVRRPWEVYGKVCLMRGCRGLEEAYLVIGSVAAARSRWCGAGGREIEFVDPRADDKDIVGIMERVRESFRVELGDETGLVGPGKRKREGEVEGEVGLVPKVVVSEGGCRRAICA